MTQKNTDAAGIARGRVLKRRAEAVARRRALRQTAANAAPDGPDALRAAATAAHMHADYDKALELWAELRLASPGSSEGFANAILTARSAGRMDIAKQLADDAAVRFPEEAKSFLAQSETAPEDADEALWQELLTRPPVDRKLELAAAQAPLKRPSGGKRRYKIALARVETVLKRFPKDAEIVIVYLGLLRKLGRLDKAARMAEAFRRKFPADQRLALLHVAILDGTKDYEGAFKLISSLRETFAPAALVEVAYSEALSRLGRLDAAEEACALALQKFPDSSDLVREHAALASRRGDWTEALSRWQTAKEKFPGNLKVGKGLAAVRLQLADQNLPDTEIPQDETGRLFARFESLGGTQGGCEFGIVQRKYGSMSLGALRWATVGREPLVTGLYSSFEGLGEVANTQLKTYKASADREEYIVSDTRYGLGSHTFIEPKDVPADKMLIQTAKRLKFLRGKLLEDLQEARKIFVYKFHTPADDATIRDVFKAARTRGDVTLLCMLKANDDNPKGSLRQLDTKLYAGYLGHFMSEGPIGEDSFIDYLTWKDICTRMLAAHDAATPPQDASA